jgi:hypothetical protein
MTTTTSEIETLEANVEEVAEEVRVAEGLLRQARRQVTEAQQRFAELEEERSVLSPKVFAGDKEAAAELEELEDTHDKTARQARAARSAIPTLEAQVEEAKAKLKQARDDVHRHHAAEVQRDIVALDVRRATHSQPNCWMYCKNVRVRSTGTTTPSVSTTTPPQTGWPRMPVPPTAPSCAGSSPPTSSAEEARGVGGRFFIKLQGAPYAAPPF